MCLSKMTVASGGRPGIPSWKLAEGNKDMSCDHCLKLNRLCIRIVKIDGEYRFGIQPVPENLREGSTWEDTRFWLLP
ncbi:hypothetical protein K504DRAFT_212383 [Pleomassaria siparia CBS 279.74]|uniref:Uncharacterized protein n=1 Tax=Pleomassaria siparia CBS 279.74 TaxID=1314801 RepID=A0A6G1KJZ2_9PLEO|nr:hypothetical protein K504DRAFT_212383 [Pleomassaria siparia CBS 279.74]